MFIVIWVDGYLWGSTVDGKIGRLMFVRVFRGAEDLLPATLEFREEGECRLSKLFIR